MPTTKKKLHLLPPKQEQSCHRHWELSSESPWHKPDHSVDWVKMSAGHIGLVRQAEVETENHGRRSCRELQILQGPLMLARPAGTSPRRALGSCRHGLLNSVRSTTAPPASPELLEYRSFETEGPHHHCRGSQRELGHTLLPTSEELLRFQHWRW